jgi:hypothetical protein
MMDAYSDFRENPINGIDAEKRPQIDRRSDISSLQDVYFCFVENA